MFSSPKLPWEVLERIINHSGDNLQVLRNISLTCRQLRPRCLCLMVTDIALSKKSRADVFALCDFLQVYPHLGPLVGSITSRPDNFPPFPLLHVLPNLSQLTFTRGTHNTSDQRLELGSLPLSVLTCYRRFGTPVVTLRLSYLSFPTYAEFCRLLLAFASIREFYCDFVKIRQTDITIAQLDRTTRCLSQSLHIRTLTLVQLENPLAKLLLESTHQTMETLVLTADQDTASALCQEPLPVGSGWARLRSLTLQLPLNDHNSQFNASLVENAIGILKGFQTPRLATTTIDFTSGIRGLLRWIGDKEDSLGLCLDLDRTLAGVGHQRRILFSGNPVCSRRRDFWHQELAKYFPGLAGQGLLTVATKSATVIAHHGEVHSLVCSPNSNWIATGADDSTIILWDSDGHLVQEWVAHAGSVLSLAFSPDGQYLASAGQDKKVAVWDISQSPRKIATLEGHAYTVESCAWSPDGTVIASGSYDTTIRLWDARTFRLLIVLKSPNSDDVFDVRFSPDGRWLVSQGMLVCTLWDLMSGAPPKVLHSDGHIYLDAFAFDPESKRIAAGSDNGGIGIWDLLTGELLSVVEQHTSQVSNVAFSPDGKLLLSTSWDNPLILWDASTHAIILSLEGHAGRTDTACFSPCGKYVAAEYSDKAVRLWRTDDGSCMTTLSEHPSGARLLHVAFSPDGKTLSSGASDGTVSVRRMSDIMSP
ncbi:WD40-repeat-containing domain protein [Dichomitus squalens]|uniref:WD40-repeat-containing domain protein n=1 Tax=Dichomitus squalens TaxID=114155 RepID=A0A4Q9MQW6_9APHY|nr:WD40-repeat-containing domain protein [Dichomitus squalens]